MFAGRCLGVARMQSTLVTDRSAGQGMQSSTMTQQAVPCYTQVVWQAARHIALDTTDLPAAAAQRV
jgi:hypothetical protein